MSFEPCGIRLIFATAITVLMGCGPSTPNQRVAGEVTLDGVPVAKGSISLIPEGKGPTAGADVIDGAYDIAGDRGPLPGTYRVQISAMVETDKIERDPDSGESWRVPHESIPPRYNERTELTITVTPDGPNEFNFPLTSAPK